MTANKNFNWYVLVTRSRHEKKCELLLKRKGIEVYLPLQKVMREWSDRRKKVEIPLFSGYLFIFYDGTNRADVLATPGVVRFVRYDQQDAIIPPSQIQSIRFALDHSIPMDIADQHFGEGEEIMIKSGPFAGLYGKIIRYKSKRKLQISIGAIGKFLLIEIGKTLLEKIPGK
jgi:transcriptional antiterminator RfaH